MYDGKYRNFRVILTEDILTLNGGQINTFLVG